MVIIDWRLDNRQSFLILTKELLPVEWRIEMTVMKYAYMDLLWSIAPRASMRNAHCACCVLLAIVDPVFVGADR